MAASQRSSSVGDMALLQVGMFGLVPNEANAFKIGWLS